MVFTNPSITNTLIDMYITPFSGIKNKTGKHKDWFNVEFIKIFCQQINPNNIYFKNAKFINHYKANYSKLELKERLNLIADLVNDYCELSYQSKLKLFKPLLGKKLPFEKGMFTYCYQLYPVSQFIEKNGTQNIDHSLKFIKEITMRFTGEWAIRPLANFNQQKILAQMKNWATDKNFHVRRLASEGLRPRLPWGLKIDWVNKNPSKILPIYNKLRNDPILYVRRSVANSMGDIVKIDEQLALETFNKWLKQKKTAENLWVIRHAIRNPLKKETQKFIELNNKIKFYKSTL